MAEKWLRQRFHLSTQIRKKRIHVWFCIISMPMNSVLLCYASNFKKICELFDTWAENEGRVIEITHLTKEFTPDYCAALLGLHAFTRCYTTSSFKGIGKVKPLKILQKKALYQEVLKCLGEFWDINWWLLPRTWGIHMCNVLQKYKNKRGWSLFFLNAVDQKAFITSHSPLRVCLQEHTRRVNDQVRIWKNAQYPDPGIPHPTGDCGWRMNKGRLEPRRFKGTPLLSWRLEKAGDEEDDMPEDSDSENDYDRYRDHSASVGCDLAKNFVSGRLVK